MNDTVSGREKHRTFSYITLSVLVVLFIIAVVAATGADVDARQTGAQVSAGVSGGSYSVICVWRGESMENALSVLEKLGVKAVFFTTSETAAADVDSAKSITAGGHYLGVDCAATEGMNGGSSLLWLAKQNDGFCSITGRRPKYCLIREPACLYASDAAAAYGQRCVREIKAIVNDGEEIESGDVVLCVAESEDTLKAFETAVFAAAARGLAPASPGSSAWGK